MEEIIFHEVTIKAIRRNCPPRIEVEVKNEKPQHQCKRGKLKYADKRDSEERKDFGGNHNATRITSKIEKF